MKKIRCCMDKNDWVKVVIAQDTVKPEDVIIEVSSSEDGCIRLNPEKIHKLRKQLKRALLEIEGAERGGEKDCDCDLCKGKKAQGEGDDWFSEGKTVKVTGDSNSHHFPIGAIARIVAVTCPDEARAEYLDGHDYWWVKKEDCCPCEEDKSEYKEGDKVYLLHGDCEAGKGNGPFVYVIDLNHPVKLISKGGYGYWKVEYTTNNSIEVNGYAREESFGRRA